MGLHYLKGKKVITDNMVSFIWQKLPNSEVDGIIAAARKFSVPESKV